jgi:signal transduction histidine kinase
MRNDALPDVELANLVDLSPDMLFRCERRADGLLYLTFSEGRLAQTLHLTTRENQDRPLLDLVPADVFERILPEYEQCFEGHPREFVHEWAGRTVRHRPQCVFGPDQDVMAVVGAISDETELHRLSQELRASEDELVAFSYNVSQDLRTPLTILDSSLQLLEERSQRPSPEASGRNMVRMRHASQRMTKLIQDLLGFGRAARSELQLQDIDVTALARGVVEKMRAQDPDRRIDVRILPGLTCRGDKILVRNVLEQLLGNAWKYTGKRNDARVELGSVIRGGREWLFVKDNGVGFDPSQAGRLFHAFERLHDPSEFEGTGIGLATVARILRRHGGTIRAEAAPGEGATFLFHTGGSRPAKTPAKAIEVYA